MFLTPTNFFIKNEPNCLSMQDKLKTKNYSI